MTYWQYETSLCFLYHTYWEWMNKMGSPSASLKNLLALCDAMSLDSDLLLLRAKALLRLYRSVASVVKEKTNLTVRESSVLYEGEGSFLEGIKAGLSYLADFEPESKRKDFEAKVSTLFETYWVIELMNQAIERVHGHFDNGNKYYYILYNGYFDKDKYSNDDLQDLMDVAHSTFHKYKREATLLFGIYLWGHGIPELYRRLSRPEDFRDKKTD